MTDSSFKQFGGPDPGDVSRKQQAAGVQTETALNADRLEANVHRTESLQKKDEDLNGLTTGNLLLVFSMYFLTENMTVTMIRVKRHSVDHLSYKHFLFPHSTGLTLFLKKPQNTQRRGPDWFRY